MKASTDLHGGYRYHLVKLRDAARVVKGLPEAE